jgi:hypothetical protein
MTQKFKHRMGLEARDIITNFKGIIVYRAQHITGCNTYGIQPQLKEGSDKTEDMKSFDEHRLDIIGEGVAHLFPELEEKKEEKMEIATPPKGGPQPLVLRNKPV